MTKSGRIVSFYLGEIHIKKIESLIGIGRPGDNGYFASKSEFVRSAIERFIDDLARSGTDSHEQSANCPS